MADKTDYLSLTLPDNGEYVDNWDQPVNANFEEVDDHLNTLNNNLVGTGGDTSNLKGSKASLQQRLDVGLNADGTIKLETSEDYTDLAISKIYGTSSATDPVQKILDRFDNVEAEVVDLRLNEGEDRYGNPGGTIVRGVARMSAVYQGATNQAMPSPIRGFTPNSVVGCGAWDASALPFVRPTYVTSESDKIKIDGDTGIGVWFNIDGMLFKIVDGLFELDFSESSQHKVSEMVDGTYYLWASRKEGDYNRSSSEQWSYTKYNGQLLGGVFCLDPRIIPTHASLRADASSASDPTDGVVTADENSLTSALANFSSYQVSKGDILVISSPAELAGRYIVDSADDPNTLYVYAKFRSSSAAVTFHVERPTVPSIGFSSTMTYIANRVYFGSFVVESHAITSVTPFVPNGIYDSGWAKLDDIGWNNQPHYLGTVPSRVDVFLKDDASGMVTAWPTTKIDIQHGDGVGDTTWGICTVTVPAVEVKADESEFNLTCLLPTGDINEAFHDGTDYIANDVDTHSLRVILRR